MEFSEAYSLPEHYRSVAPELQESTCRQALPELRQTLADLLKDWYHNGEQGLLIVLQGMDASGKDGLVRRNFKDIATAYFHVAEFKQPTAAELAHDFLWRVHPHCPAKGRTTIFNRSHYEDVLVPGAFKHCSAQELLGRMQSILDFEDHLLRNHTQVVRFFLNISHQRQGEKIAERQTNPKKQHKFKPSDITNRQHWDAFMEQYQSIFNACKGPKSWFNIPCDIKWQKDYVFLQIIIEKLREFRA